MGRRPRAAENSTCSWPRVSARYTPPRHRHRDASETFIVLEGEILMKPARSSTLPQPGMWPSPPGAGAHLHRGQRDGTVHDPPHACWLCGVRSRGDRGGDDRRSAWSRPATVTVGSPFGSPISTVGSLLGSRAVDLSGVRNARKQPLLGSFGGVAPRMSSLVPPG